MIEVGHRGGVAVRSAPAREGHEARAHQRARPTLLWIHGLGESGGCFDGMLTHPRLAGYSQVAVDLIGYGRSPWPREPLDLDEHARFLSGWAERQIAGPIVIVGHSMGGVIGQLICEEVARRTSSPRVAGLQHAPLPGVVGLIRVVGLINVEGNLSRDDCRTASARAAAQDSREFTAKGFDELLADTFLRGATDLAWRGYFASMRWCDPRQFHRNSCELVALSESDTLAARLAALDLPRAYVGGRPGGVADHSLELLARAGIEPRLIEPAGHWPFIDRPDDFAVTLVELLEPPR